MITNRKSLSVNQQEFLDKVIPLAVLVQNWTIGKSQFRGRIRSSVGVRASIILADILIASEWGTHPIAQHEYEGKNANNLSLLESSKTFTGKIIKHNGILYRTYRKWHDFAVDYSDHLVFSDQYNEVLRSPDLEEQIAYFCLKKLDNRVYTGKISALIDFYALSEIDIYGQKT